MANPALFHLGHTTVINLISITVKDLSARKWSDKMLSPIMRAYFSGVGLLMTNSDTSLSRACSCEEGGSQQVTTTTPE